MPKVDVLIIFMSTSYTNDLLSVKLTFLFRGPSFRESVIPQFVHTLEISSFGVFKKTTPSFSWLIRLTETGFPNPETSCFESCSFVHRSLTGNSRSQFSSWPTSKTRNPPRLKNFQTFSTLREFSTIVPGIFFQRVP